MFMKLVLVIVFLFNIGFMLSCGSKNNSGAPSKEEIANEKKRKGQIKSLLIDCQITLSELSGMAKLSDYNESTIKLNKQLAGFSGSVHVVARVRGVLLENSRVLTSLKVYYGSDQRTYDTYAALFDGTTKKLISSVFLGARLDAISVFKKSSGGGLIGIDALVREEGKPASEIKEFTIEVEDKTIALQ